MSPLHHNQHSPFPSLGDNHQDQTQIQLMPFFQSYQTSSLTSTISLSSQQEGGGYIKSNGSEASIGDSEEKINCIKKLRGDASPKWMPSKMRLMKRMIDSNKTFERKPRRNTIFPPTQTSTIDTTNSCNDFIRVCSNCNTTKTPLWRSGPQGPKSLCNACGIRQRKARKAMAEAAAKDDHCGLLIPSTGQTKVSKGKGLEEAFAIVPLKKRCKYTSKSNRDDREDFTTPNSSDCCGVFPQDEKEAAILLMALSCGLICR